MRFRKLNRNQLEELLPFYLNGSLTRAEELQVEAWLREDPEARSALESWRKIQRAVSSQADSKPAGRAYLKLLERVHSTPAKTQQPAWRRTLSLELLGSVLLALLVLVGLWRAVAPGIALEWSLQGEGVSAFRVYRARVGYDRFNLISEIPAQAGRDRYSFVDVHLFPAGEYIYRVEAIGDTGDLAVSRAITSSSLGVLPGQLAIVLASLLTGVASIKFFSVLRAHPWSMADRAQFT